MIKRLWHKLRYWIGPEERHWDAMGMTNRSREPRCPRCGTLTVHTCAMVCFDYCPQCDRCC